MICSALSQGLHDGRPRYVERSKARGEPFKVVTPAEIVYCQAIEAWVFRHPDIKTASYPPNEVNEESLTFFDCDTTSFLTICTLHMNPERLLLVDENSFYRFVRPH